MDEEKDDARSWDFMKKSAGPGEFDRHNFEKIPPTMATWEGLRLGIAEYLNECWVFESVDTTTVIVRRTDRPVTINIHTEVKKDAEGEWCYFIYAKLLVPDEVALQYMTFHGCFHEQLSRQLGMPLWAKTFISAEQLEGFAGCQYTLAVDLGEPPNAQQVGMVARWMTWSLLALDWVAESADLNDSL